MSQEPNITEKLRAVKLKKEIELLDKKLDADKPSDKVIELNELISTIDGLDQAAQFSILEHLRKKEMGEVIGKIERLPDLANDEFKVFDETLSKKVTPKTIEIRKRRYALFCYYYAHPELTDEQMINFIQLCHNDLSYVQAIRDLNKVKHVIGNMPKARKELIRFQVIELFKMNLQKARALDDVMGVNGALNGIGKYANLEKEDNEIPWEEYVPPDFEPTDDIAVLNPELKPYNQIDREKIRRRYLNAETVEPLE